MVPVLAPPPELLRSLGRLWRGLHTLFWTLPLALIVFGLLWIQSNNSAPSANALTAWLESLNIFPPLFVTALLLYGLRHLSEFQKQERVWQAALERTQISGWVNLGLSPFLFWWSALPDSVYFSVAVRLLMLSSLLFLAQLNRVLDRLAAMLPDETLRADTRFFTRLNLALVSTILALVAIGWALFSAAAVSETSRTLLLPKAVAVWVEVLAQIRGWMLLLLLLIPVALTMTLIWKIKELILASVFNEASAP